MRMNDTKHWMDLALDQARLAAEAGEVPVGAVLVMNNQLVAAAGNSQIGSNDPSAHAEINCLRLAAAKLGNYRPPQCDLYVTLEPCSMCAGAMVHGRIGRLYFGASEPRAGAIESRLRLLQAPWLNHRIEVQGGICAQESAKLLEEFFKSRRQPG